MNNRSFNITVPNKQNLAPFWMRTKMSANGYNNMQEKTYLGEYIHDIIIPSIVKSDWLLNLLKERRMKTK